MQIKFSSFDSLSGNRVHLEKMEEKDFEAFIREPYASDKRELPLLSFAVYGKDKTSKGSYRHDKNVLSLTGGKVDHDSGRISFEEAVESIKKLNARAFIHTTSSHNRVCSSNPKGGPRFHVFFPFSQPIKGEEDCQIAMHNWMIETAFLDPSDESAVMSQGFFYGREEGSKKMQFYHHQSNKCIDEVVDLFREIPPVKQADEFEPGERDWTKNRQKALSMLMKIDPDIGYWDWYRAMGAAKLSGCTVEDLITWSSLGTKFKGEAEVIQKYNDLDRDDGAGPGTLHYLAKAFPADPEEDEDEAIIEEYEGFKRFPEGGIPKTDPPAYLVGQLITRGEAGQLVGPGGVGKSTLAMMLSVCVCIGRPFLGIEEFWTPAGGDRVLYISGEDGEVGFTSRMRAIHQAMKLTPKEYELFRTNFAWMDLREKSSRKFRAMMRPSADNKHEFEEGRLAKLLRKHVNGYGLVFLDPMSSITAGEENSNDAMKRLAEISRDVADDTGAAIMTVQHTGKGQREYSQHAGRGASAQADGARMVLQVGPVRKNEIEVDGIKYTYPPSLGITDNDLDENQVMLFANLKQTWSKRSSTPLFILRDGFKFTADWGLKARDSNFDEEDEQAKLELEVLQFIAENKDCEYRDLSARFGKEKNSRRTVDSLIESGLVKLTNVKAPRKSFRITYAGEERLQKGV